VGIELGDAGTLWLELGALLLLGALGAAAVLDLRTREVPDGLWQGVGLVGAAGGAVVVAPGGWLPLLLWLVVAGLALEHVFPWDSGKGGLVDRWADPIELVAYAGVGITVGVALLRFGLGSTGVPPMALALLATVVVARVLFEVGVLYGGADAKALIVAGVLVPLYPTTWLALPAHAGLVTSILPFAANLLMDAAVLSAIIPLSVAVRNARRGEFSFRTGFTTYTIPVSDLPHRFAWVRDPSYPIDRDEENAIETSEEDRQWRIQVARKLDARGIARVRVGPQIPFIVLLFAGAIGALALGNWIIDLLALL
jgi:prepilin signal peptidase PulO-like enzyme (type II secretory pathway)